MRFLEKVEYADQILILKCSDKRVRFLPNLKNVKEVYCSFNRIKLLPFKEEVYCDSDPNPCLWRLSYILRLKNFIQNVYGQKLLLSKSVKEDLHLELLNLQYTPQIWSFTKIPKSTSTLLML